MDNQFRKAVPTAMTIQLDRWAGEFGDQYTARNIVDWRDRIGAWWTMLGDLSFTKACEIGANRGHNILAIEVLYPGKDIWGIEPNRTAIHERCQHPWHRTVFGSIELGCLTSGRWPQSDLVFTCGVLIHVPPDELDATLRKIHQLSRKYILCIEYFAEQETTVEYQGLTDMLWKRNWPHEYESRFPNLKLIRSGFWGKESGFDSVNWWLWEKL